MCLGVLLDITLTFAPHVRRLAGRCFYHLHLRQLRTVRRSLTADAAKTMVHSFVINRIDYCNSVLYGSYAPTTECPQLRGPSGAKDDEVSTYYCSRPRSASLAACETTCGVQAGVIRVQGPPSDSSTVPCLANINILTYLLTYLL